MDLNKKDIIQIAGMLIGFFLFIYLFILVIPPVVYFANNWFQKWDIKN